MSYHSVEIAGFLRSHFLRKDWKKFRENEAKSKYAQSTYLVKPLLGIKNSKFLRNFAQHSSSYYGRGGSNLQLDIECPADHCGP